MEQENLIINLKIANDMLLKLNQKMADLINALLLQVNNTEGKRTNDQQ